jgi:hypothetical protein
MWAPLYVGHAFNTNPEAKTANSPTGTVHRKTHFDINRAVDMTRLSCVLHEMQKAGTPEQTCAQFKAMADVLVGLMVTENNRNHGY